MCTAPELADLDYEVRQVTNWICFGLYLGIEMSRLSAIEMEHRTLSMRRVNMLQEWCHRRIPTWSAVVQALVGIGMRRLATELAQKHGWFDSHP